MATIVFGVRGQGVLTAHLHGNMLAVLIIVPRPENFPKHAQRKSYHQVCVVCVQLLVCPCLDQKYFIFHTIGLQQLVREHKALKEKESLFNSKVQKINNFFDNGLVKIMKSIEQISQM